MEQNITKPQILNIFSGEGLEIRQSAFGRVGKLFSGEGVEVVWIKKEGDEIDPDWFSQPMVDLILVVQGKLKMEFERDDLEPRVLESGDMIILPPETRCRAYHWPREDEGATVFLAVYPAQESENLIG